MKNFIYQNYNIEIDKIYNKENYNYFFAGENKIIIVNVPKVINDKLINLSNEICLYYPVSTFLINKKKEYLCKYKNGYIALLKINCIDIDRIEFNDVMELEILKNKINVNKYLKKYDISKEWERKIDEYEHKLMGNNKEYPKIKDSINYYLGIAENAIQMMKIVKESHGYIGVDSKIEILNVENFHNPINYINTCKCYNYAKYIKHKFYYEKFEYEELYTLISNIKKEENIIELFALLLYPDYYFELLENDTYEFKEKILDSILSKRKKYEEMLAYYKKITSSNNYIQQIMWF